MRETLDSSDLMVVSQIVHSSATNVVTWLEKHDAVHFVHHILRSQHDRIARM